jgi:hypothetical protein
LAPIKTSLVDFNSLAGSSYHVHRPRPGKGSNKGESR